MFGTTTDERKRMYTFGVFSGENYDLVLAYPDKAAISPTVYGPVLNNTFHRCHMEPQKLVNQKHHHSH